jgi:hypothetical protein
LLQAYPALAEILLDAKVRITNATTRVTTSPNIMVGSPPNGRLMSEHPVFAKCAWRLIPLMILLYLVNYIDRVNVGFAALTMNRDLAFSPAVYGFGAGVFFLESVRRLYQGLQSFPQTRTNFVISAFAGEPTATAAVKMAAARGRTRRASKRSTCS